LGIAPKKFYTRSRLGKRVQKNFKPVSKLGKWVQKNFIPVSELESRFKEMLSRR
jgi:hypothetical protein